MYKSLSMLIGAIAIASIGLLSFQADAASKRRIVLLVNGTLGDKSFFDSADLGLKAIREKYTGQVETKTIEMGYDQSKWEPTLEDIAEQNWDLIVVGTYQMTDILASVSKGHPDKHFIIFDAKVPYDKDQFQNVYSIEYKQNEGAYLGGMLAAGLIADGKVAPRNGTSIGFLGGMDIPVINDFLVGYIAGARAVKPDIKVAVSYVGNFGDAAKGKELALAQYGAGVGIGFNVAARAGLGQLAAGKDTGKYVLGVDGDQAAAFAKTDPIIASLIVSSVLKRVDQSLIRAYDLFVEGKLPFGQSENLGLKERSVGLVESGNMDKMASPQLKQRINDAEAAIVAGTIVVPSAMHMDTAAVNQIRESVRP